MDRIVVRQGTPQSIARAVEAYASLWAPDHKQTCRVDITRVDGGHVITIEPKAPAYSFANLLCWVDAPPDIDDVGDAVGWYRSREPLPDRVRG